MRSGLMLFTAIALCHIGVSFIVNRIPYRNIAMLRSHIVPNQAESEFYRKVLHIGKWKDLVPSFGPFDKKTLKGNSVEYLSQFILETVRAELAYVLCILSMLSVLYIYKPVYPLIIPLFYIIINIPCIIIKRYNRGRLERIMEKLGQELIIPENQVLRKKFV